MLFFAKFRSHRVKNEKVMTENLSQLNALVLITEPPEDPTPRQQRERRLKKGVCVLSAFIAILLTHLLFQM